jgi:hypothetical protein
LPKWAGAGGASTWICSGFRVYSLGFGGLISGSKLALKWL